GSDMAKAKPTTVNSSAATMHTASARSVVVGVFTHPSQAERAAQALRARGIRENEINLFAPDAAKASPSETSTDGLADVDMVLRTMGLSEGELRFYSGEVASGHALLIVAPTQHDAAVRDLILQHSGYDVQSRGAELVRPAGAGVPGG